jgi:hypothetical protein
MPLQCWSNCVMVIADVSYPPDCKISMSLGDACRSRESRSESLFISTKRSIDAAVNVFVTLAIRDGCRAETLVFVATSLSPFATLRSMSFVGDQTLTMYPYDPGTIGTYRSKSASSAVAPSELFCIAVEFGRWFIASKRTKVVVRRTTTLLR